MTGFEPAASSSRTKRATRLRYIPNFKKVFEFKIAVLFKTLNEPTKQFKTENTYSKIKKEPKRIKNRKVASRRCDLSNPCGNKIPTLTKLKNSHLLLKTQRLAAWFHNPVKILLKMIVGDEDGSY